MNTSYQTFTKNQPPIIKKIKRTRVVQKHCTIYPNPVYDFYKKPKSFFRLLPYVSVRILNVLIEMRQLNNYKWLAPSQALLGKKTGYSREWINKGLKPLEQAAFVYSIYRHFRTSEYRIARCLFSKRMKRKLWKFLPALMITISGQFTQSKEVLDKLSNYINNNNNYIVSTTRVRARALPNQKSCCCSKKYHKFNQNHPPVVHKKENIMSRIPYQQYQTVDAIKHIASLKLTRAGKLMLSRFHALAIKAADGQLLSKKRRGEAINDPFRYFETVCANQSEQNGYEKNNEIVERAYLAGALNVSAPDDMLEENKVFGDTERPKYGAYSKFEGPPVPKYSQLCYERDECIAKLQQPAPPSASFLGEEVYFTFLKNKIDHLTKRIKEFK